jgi:hypothetical protein
VLAARTFKNDETGSPGPLGPGLAEGFGGAGADAFLAEVQQMGVRRIRPNTG